MKKRSLFSALLGACLIMPSSYFFSQLEIFDSPKIQFSSPHAAIFEAQPRHDALYCGEASMPVEEIRDRRFRLMSWNVHKGADQGWQQDLKHFAQQNDFVLLQEATPEQDLTDFSTALFVSAFSYRDQLSGIKTFAKALPQAYCVSSVGEPWIRIPKVAGALYFPLPNGESLLIINAHLINFEVQPNAYKAQLEQVFSLIREHQSAVILAGDFNAWRDARKNLLDEFAAEVGLKEVHFSPDHRVQFLSHPLDFIFTRGVKVHSADSKPVNSSDHAPIFIDFELVP